MSVRVSRKLLEAALAGLNEADGGFEAEKDYDGLAAKLSNAPDGARWSTPDIEGMGDGFVKRNGMWYVSTELTSEQLTQILAPSGEEKLARADERESTDLALDASDFVVGVGKGVNFVREKDGGAWRDNTPIESKMLAAYKFKDRMGEVMPVTREGTLRMVKDDKFMFLLDQSSLEFYIMDVNNDPNDPLASMKRLFDNATVNGKFGISDQDVIEAKKIAKLAGGRAPPTFTAGGDKDAYKQQLAAYNAKFGTKLDELQDYAKSFKRIVPFVDEPKAFKFNTNFFRGGKIEDAMNSARTIFGAFFDLFTPGTDLEMEFKLTQWGPAFARRTQFVRKLMGKKTSMSDSDFAKFAETDYFEVVTMPNASGEYKLSGSTTKNVTVSSETFPEVGGTETPVLDVKAEGNTYGWAYVLYLLGILTRGEVEEPVVAPPSPTPAPAPPSDPAGEVKKYVEDSVFGKPLGDGALFFDFDKDQIKAGINVNAYYQSVAEAVKVHVDKIKAILAGSSAQPGSDTYKRWFDVTIISTSDPVGTAAYNAGLADRRKYFSELKDVIEKVAGPAATENTPGIYYVYSKPLGESPWTTYTKISDKSVQTDVHEFLRFSKAFGDKTTTASDGTYQDWARDFAKTKITTLDSLKESAEIKQIRDQIRRIILEGSRRHE